ncbi:MAG: uracil-DNA glycosylase family protein [Muribaculaceae bacterium]|nr:uracil-DNA glycosylase family protein [Muribaculaceae bacterium]
MELEELIIEYHPWEPFVPPNARILIMGTFPPQKKRWSMDFYYPNRTNDFWYMMGLIFFHDRNYLLDSTGKNFDVDAIKRLLTEKGIALNDTGRKVRRLKGNASDKYLEIIEPVPLYTLLESMPQCHVVATTGEKAASVIAGITGTVVPAMGKKLEADGGLEIWRMPSTSRAYPLKLEKKAEYYARMFRDAGIY